MTRRKKILVLLGFGCMAGTALVCIAMFDMLDQPKALERAVLSGKKEKMAPILKAMGTNAIPYLMAWLEDESQPGRSLLPFLPSKARAGHQAYLRGTYTDFAFEILGPEAASAIPRLEQLANRRSSIDFAGGRAALALSHLGEKAVPALINVLTNLHSEQRPTAALALGEMGTNAARAIPALISCLDSDDSTLGAWSADALGKLRLDPEHVVPALISALSNPEPHQRSRAAAALGLYGTDAKASIPALLKATGDSDLDVRAEATQALRAIAPDLLTNAPAQKPTDKGHL